jgi:hypothetical protein
MINDLGLDLVVANQVDNGRETAHKLPTNIPRGNLA